MRLLLDTHIFCWWFYEPERLSQEALEIMNCAECVFVSAASMWEIAIKVRLGKMTANLKELFAQIAVNNFEEMPVLSRQALLVADLPLHHTDPFDRLLIAQAISEALHLITADAQLRQYSELVIQI
ncbi:MAG: type II toxin-antitoxin system VapC family toxin [Acidobacteriota bacterium]|nr:type II toxin-antitoxin system VapC family toxin [Acidobacteriota bacterium]